MDTINGNKIKYQNWMLVATLFMLSGMVAAMHQFKIPTIMTQVAGSFNMPLEQAAWLMSIFTFVGIFLALPTGGLAQKFGPKNMVITAAILVAAGSILGATATSGGMLILSRGIEGVGFIFVTVCGPMAIGRYCEPSKLGSAMGIWAVWVSVGQVLASNLTAPLYASIGLSGTWIVYAVVALVLTAAVAVAIKTPPELAPANFVQSDVKTSEVFKNKDLWFLCLSFITFNLLLMSALAFVPTYLTENGVSVAAAGFAVSLPMILGIAASPIFGSLSDKIGSTKALHLISLFAMLPGIIMMFSSTGAVMYVGAIIVGLIGMGHPAMVLASIGKVNPKPELAGAGIGLLMTCQGLGMFLGSMLMVYFLQWSGTWTAGAWFLVPIAIIGLIFGALSKFR
ncbi:MAG TPA: MFS transporter [Syntrophomonas sp.]|nr:MFS transporter [Syntrophomonas sp.]